MSVLADLDWFLPLTAVLTDTFSKEDIMGFDLLAAIGLGLTAIKVLGEFVNSAEKASPVKGTGKKKKSAVTKGFLAFVKEGVENGMLRGSWTDLADPKAAPVISEAIDLVVELKNKATDFFAAPESGDLTKITP